MSKCPDCSCNDFEKCRSILNLLLDNEASEAQEDFFYRHIASCIVCFANYNIEKELRQLIKRKVNRKSIPGELASQIRSQIIG